MDENNNKKFSKLSLLFQSAITLSNHEGDLIWSRFSAFIVTHTILFAFIGFLLESHSANRELFLLVISIVGLILAFLWFLSTKRGFEALEYWDKSAREFEVKLLGENQVTSLFIRGERYFKLNREVEFTFGDKKVISLQRGCLTRCIPLSTRWTAYLSIILILGLYLLVIVLYLLRLLPFKTP